MEEVVDGDHGGRASLPITAHERVAVLRAVPPAGRCALQAAAVLNRVARPAAEGMSEALLPSEPVENFCCVSPPGALPRAMQLLMAPITTTSSLHRGGNGPRRRRRGT
jgi:hypothetical protein